MHCFFPNLFSEMNQLEDNRKRKEYATSELVMAAVAMFLFKEGSRNAFNNDRNHSEQFTSNFEKLFGCKLPHMDTVQPLFKELKPLQLEELKIKQVQQLIEKKVLHQFKLFDCFMVSVDATGVISSDKDIFGCGLRKEYGETISYQYHVLEAKLVTECGLCIPLASEWIINEPGAQEVFDKQDCEQKAFKRLAAKLKKYFPRLPICLLADALYANDPVMGICEQYGWKYIITLQPGSLPGVQDCLKDDPRSAHNTFSWPVPSAQVNSSVSQELYWVEDLLHKKHVLHYLECVETIRNHKTGKEQQAKFVRITNLPTSKSTIKKLSRAARLRWKIENEGFNEQKNNGYAMEHLFCRKSFTAFQNYYQCLLIAHLINQLVENSCLVQLALQQHSKLTIKHLWKIIISTMQFGQLCRDTITSILQKRHQIRLYVQ